MFLQLPLLCECSVMSHSLQSHWAVAHQGPLLMEFCKQEY